MTITQQTKHLHAMLDGDFADAEAAGAASCFIVDDETGAIYFTVTDEYADRPGVMLAGAEHRVYATAALASAAARAGDVIVVDV